MEKVGWNLFRIAIFGIVMMPAVVSALDLDNLDPNRPIAIEDAYVIPKGEIGNPMARDEVEQKFLSLATPITGDSRARALIDEVGCLDRRDSLEPFLSSLRVVT